MSSNRPLVGVSIIIKKDGKVLVGKRKNIRGNGTWAFPGGHLEFRESFEECIRREVMEEAGIKIKNIKFQTLTNDISSQEKTHYVTLFFTSNYRSGKVRNMEPEKCEGWEWIEWKDLPRRAEPSSGQSLRTASGRRRPLFLPIENLLKQKYNPFS